MPSAPRRSDAEVAAGVLRELAPEGGEPISLIAADGTVLYSGPAVTRLLGYLPHERQGQPAASVVHPDDMGRAQALFSGIL